MGRRLIVIIGLISIITTDYINSGGKAVANKVDKLITQKTITIKEECNKMHEKTLFTLHYFSGDKIVVTETHMEGFILGVSCILIYTILRAIMIKIIEII